MIDVKELFKIFIWSGGTDGSCLGKMHVTENSVDEAYDAMMDIIGHRLAKAFPELDIPYSIELVEESKDE